MKQSLLLILLILTFSANAQLSNDSLLAYFPFNGNVNDMSGNGYNGIANGTSYIANCDAVGNAAILFDGVSDYIDLSSFATTFRDHLDTMTIYFKFRFDKTTTNQTIISLGGDGEDLQTNVFEIEHENNRMQIETEAPNGIIDHHNNEYGVDSSAENPLFDNLCHEIMITLLEDTLTYYRDGVLLFKNEYVPSQTLATNLFLGTYVGTLTNPCCYFGGLLDELQFYNRILDISETQGNVGVNDIKKLSGFTTYPNPNQGIVNIQSERLHSNLNIQLFDILGKHIANYKIKNQQNFTIQMPETKGIYYIKISDENHASTSMKLFRQ